jgi:hypothetical protein
MKSLLQKILLGPALLLTIVVYLSSCSEDPEEAEEEKLPSIHSILPDVGIAGMQVKIVGENFATKSVDNIVTFNGVRARVISAGMNELVVEVPKDATSGDVSVQSGIHKTAGRHFKFYETFVVGNDFAGGNCVIKVWRNTDADSITNGTSNILSTSIAASGDDVYVVGYNSDGTGAFIWKNKTSSLLPAGIFADRVAIDGNDVYVLGGDMAGTKYWKNGIEVVLPTPEPYLGTLVFGFKVASTDVYLAGLAIGDNNTRFPLYWKNGVENFLTHNENDPVVVTDIAIDGSDIYVLGSGFAGSSNKLRYWKNNEVVYFTDGTAEGYASRLCVYNGDVYISGAETKDGHTHGRIWKNGVPLNLTWMGAIEDAGNDLVVVDMSIIDGNIIYMGNKTNTTTFKRVPFIAINDNVVYLPAEGFTTDGRGMFAR